MRTLYHAGSAIEAHMLADLLRQQGLRAEIVGEHLQGAIGELPAAGLVRLVIDEPDYAAARALIEQWESAQPADARIDARPPRREPRSLMDSPRFAAGLLLGVLVGFVLARCSAG